MPPFFCLFQNLKNLAKQRVFDMGSVPRERVKSVLFCNVCKDVPVRVIGSGPIPSGDDGASLGEILACLTCGQVWDEVDSQAELVRALPRSRFRHLAGQSVRLPVGEAERLEDFEAELQLVGLMKPYEIIVDLRGDGKHFGVQNRQARDPRRAYGRIQSGNLSSVGGTLLSQPASRSALGRGSRVKGLSGAALDAGETLVRQGVPLIPVHENSDEVGGA